MTRLARPRSARSNSTPKREANSARLRVVDTPGRILVADDMSANLDLLERLLTRDGHIVSRARDGHEALALVAREQPDLVLLDVMMPTLSGFDVCRTLKTREATRLIPVVLITALQDSQDRIRGIDAGADDFLSKPVNPLELQARVRSLLRLKRHTDDLESAESVILSLALTIEARDAYTDGHCQRLAAYATALGAALNLPEPDLAALKLGGILHDIGKVGIPDAILLKNGALTPAEFDVDEATYRHRRSALRIAAIAQARPAHRAPSPRALGRHRLSRPAARRRDSTAGPNHQRRGHLRRRDDRPAV